MTAAAVVSPGKRTGPPVRPIWIHRDSTVRKSSITHSNWPALGNSRASTCWSSSTLHSPRTSRPDEQMTRTALSRLRVDASIGSRRLDAFSSVNESQSTHSTGGISGVSSVGPNASLRDGVNKAESSDGEITGESCFFDIFRGAHGGASSAGADLC